MLFVVFALFSCRETTKYKYSSALVDEESPYLLQHAHNPVNQFPWSDAILEKAEIENKLLVISIGYSSCHWCHVMEEETFSQEDVAKIMNDNFISIKVDSETRPDIDQIQQTTSQLISKNGGGWP